MSDGVFSEGGGDFLPTGGLGVRENQIHYGVVLCGGPHPHQPHPRFYVCFFRNFFFMFIYREFI